MGSGETSIFECSLGASGETLIHYAGRYVNDPTHHSSIQYDIQVREDFIGGLNDSGYMSGFRAFSENGGSVGKNTTLVDEKHSGIIFNQINKATSSSRAYLRYGHYSGGLICDFQPVNMMFGTETLIRLSGHETAYSVFYIGYMDAVFPSLITNGIYFKAEDTWKACVMSSGTEIETDTGIPVVNDEWVLLQVANQLGVAERFIINEMVVAEITAGIPTANLSPVYMGFCHSPTGAGMANMYVDNICVKGKFLSRRY